MPIGRQIGYLPFGEKYLCRLPYVSNNFLSASGTTGLSVADTYRINSMYDPNFAVGGSQPLQFDTLAANYERFWVKRVHVVLTFSNPSLDGMWVGFRLRAATNTITTASQGIDYLSEMANTEIRPLNNTGEQTVAFEFDVDLPKLFGITAFQYGNLEYSHTTAANAGVDAWLEPFAIHTVTGETGVARYQVKITYHADCTNRITQAQS
jgi:hypothetical protein